MTALDGAIRKAEFSEGVKGLQLARDRIAELEKELAEAKDRIAGLDTELAVRNVAIYKALYEDTSTLPREPNDEHRDWRAVNEQLAIRFEQVLIQARQEAPPAHATNTG